MITFFVAAFIGIVWTHRPDLSVREILKEIIKELKSGKEK